MYFGISRLPLTTTTMKLTTFQQAKEHYRMGYYSLITDGGSYCVLSFPDKNTNGLFKRSICSASEFEALNDNEITDRLSTEDTINQWRMVRAIHPSHYMGSGFRVGDTVCEGGILQNAYTITEINTANNIKKYRLGYNSLLHNHESLVPAPFEKQDSQAVLDAIELLKREGKLVDGKVLNA